jgi:hypothetical protein
MTAVSNQMITCIEHIFEAMPHGASTAPRRRTMSLKQPSAHSYSAPLQTLAEILCGRRLSRNATSRKERSNSAIPMRVGPRTVATYVEYQRCNSEQDKTAEGPLIG